MVRFVLLALVLVSACQPSTAERCCEAMFPNRPQVEDILAGYAGRRVYDQQMLITAISDENVRKIIIAKTFTLSRTLTLPATRPGLTIEGVYGAALTIPSDFSDAEHNAAFRLLGDRQAIRDLHVDAPQGGGITYIVDAAAADLSVEGVTATGNYLVKTSAASARLLVSRNRVTNVASNNPIVTVEGDDVLISQNVLEGLDAEIVVADSLHPRILGNKIGSGTAGAPKITLTGATTQYGVISDNTAADGGGTIDTAGTAGDHSAVLANNAGFS